MTFITSKTTLGTALSDLKRDAHAYVAVSVPKGTMSAQQMKRTAITKITEAVNAIDTDDFSIRVLVLKVLR